jgi:hypothetical protein
MGMPAHIRLTARRYREPGALTAASLIDSYRTRLYERGQIDHGHLTNSSPYQRECLPKRSNDSLLA